ncbi:hypothetical protein ACSV5M_11485 [Cellvibrio sp. ARAG 10.3]|uniref:hypothetical protein n=1 Tax=Cellvibrio sp. ARAG 10.3 TaxID=3451358 RepID=UPI003F47E04B
MEIEVSSELKNNKNKSVLEFLAPLSCHGDIIEPIQGLLQSESGVKFFCPDIQNFKYCFWYIENTIFAFGAGMQHIGLLLPPQLSNKAISSGAVVAKSVGGNWLLFPYNHVELKKWVGLALAFSKSS